MNLEQLQQALQLPPKDLGVMEPFWPVRPRFFCHLVEQTSSTNTALRQLATAGAPAGTVLIAETQSAGRGQWGRQWQSSPGGLYLSLLLQPDAPISQSPNFTLASAWGIATSLRNLGIGVQVKWPNDLVLQGKKLGGLLSVTRIEGSLIRDVVVGVGINWSNPVPPTGITLQPFSQQHLQGQQPLNLEGLGAVVLYGIIQGYLFWQAHGEATLQNAYEAIMANLGGTLTLDDQRVEVIGISPRGNLRVKAIERNHHPEGKLLEVQPGTVTLGYNA